MAKTRPLAVPEIPEEPGSSTAPGHPMNRDEQEYQIRLHVYKYRGPFVSQEFTQMIQAFVFLATIVAGSQALRKLSTELAVTLSVFEWLVGLAVLGAYAIDIAANTSCKGALRRRGLQLETQLGYAGGSGYWFTINHRKIFLIERLFFGSKFRGIAHRLLVYAAFSLTLLWNLAAFAAVYLGIRLL